MIIHPRLDPYAGGELVCIYTIKVLKEKGYHVILASNVFEPDKIEYYYHMKNVLDNVEWYPIPDFRPVAPRFLALQRIHFHRNIFSDQEKFTGMSNNIVISTQSTIYSIPKSNLYHFIYNTQDLYAYPYGNLTLPNISYESPLWKMHYYLGLKLYYRHLMKDNAEPSVKMFFSLSHYCQNELLKMNLPCTFIPPPTQMIFHPKTKKKQVLQVTRIVKQKRLEWFFEIARRLPEYHFILVGKKFRNDNGYYEKIVPKRPSNVEFIPDVIRNRPDIVEESKVYLYTGIEQGIGIALCEAIGAGCFPLCPREGGGGEVLAMSKTGYRYNTIDEAVELTRKALELDIDPYDISSRAKMFSTEVFESRMKEIIP